MTENICIEDDFLSNAVFSDESTFPATGTVIRDTVRIWGLETLTSDTARQSQSRTKCIMCLIDE
jgi:hypothetical protein